ncbi:DUF2125 domain-containing protein [Paenirhodobacter hankyongi]|nr:DUF2125 domain-containing protein [Sinirhodobacter hankyongi]
MARVGSAAMSAAIFTLMATTALHADVTADEVWQAWTKQYTAYGYQVAIGDSARAGDTLTQRDVQLTNHVEGSDFTMTIPELRLREMGDGTVEVTGSEKISAQATSAVEGQTPLQMEIGITQANGVTIVSGTPDALSYHVTAPELVIDMDQTTAGAQTEVPVKVWMSMSGIDGTYQVTTDGGQNETSDFAIAGMKMTASGADPETNGTFNLAASLVNLKMKSTMRMPEGADLEDLGAALGKGLAMDVSGSYGATTFTVDAAAAEGPSGLSGGAQSGSFTMTLAPEGMKYAATGEGATIEAKTAQVPVPLSATLDRADFEASFPLKSSDAPQPFTGRIALDGLGLSEDVWKMVDAQGLLPHDPATLVVDLTGTARPLIDLFSPEAAQAQMPPVEVNSLEVKRLQLTLAGADLSGQGGVTFDNSLGTPTPLGAVDLKLSGANKLMDSLVKMGLMPQDQVMFARMMLGLYAVPAGDDLMTSKIEFKEGGKILANGQQIQ